MKRFSLLGRTRPARRANDTDAIEASYRREFFRSWLLFALLAAGIVLATSFYAKRSFTQSAHEELEAIATLKAADIRQWLESHQDEARGAITTPLFVGELQRWLDHGAQNDASRSLLLGHLRSVAGVEHYRDVTVRAAADGTVLLSSSDRADTVHDREKAVAVARSMRPSRDDLHFVAAAAGVDFYFPVSRSGKPTGALAVVVIQDDPATVFLPRLSHWPGGSASAETVLVTADGQHAVYLNNPRHAGNLTRRLPLSAVSRPPLLAAQALRGRTGRLTGGDYRGVPSLGFAVPVAGTNWILIAKMDSAEAYGLLNKVTLIRMLTLTALLVLAAWLISRHHRNTKAYYRHHFQLKLLAKRLDFLSRHANDAIMLSDLRGVIIEANDRALKCYGYTRAEMIGMKVSELLPPDSHEDPATIALAARESSVVQENETEHQRKGGQLFPVEVSVRMTDTDGTRHLHWITHDITARKRMEHSLRSSEERFRHAFNHAPISMAMLGLDGRFLSANAASCRLTGYSPTELSGMNYYDLTCQSDCEQHERLMAALAASLDGYAVVEMQALRKDGRRLDLSIHLSLIRDDDGLPLYILGQALDLTESKHAATRIQRLSELRAALSDTNQAILHSHTPEEVYRAVCEACVEHMNVLAAWIGLADAEAQRIIPAEAAGRCTGCLEGIVISTRADSPDGQNTSAVAYRENRVCQCNNLSASAAREPSRKCFLKCGQISAIALPILRGGEPHGTLNVFFGPENGGYGDEAPGLLMTMTQNISFAIDRFDREAERQRSEEALRVSEEKFRTLLDNLPHSVFVKNADLGFVSCNVAYARHLGITPDQISGKSAFDFYPAALAEKYENDSRQVMAVGEVAEFQEQCIEAGQPRYFNSVKLPIRNEAGQVSGVLGVLWDITENKRAEMALRRYTEEVEDLYQNAPCGYHSMTADGTITRINDTELRWLGYMRHEVVCVRKIHDLLSPASRHAFNMSYSSFVKNGIIHDVELELVRKNGVILPVTLNATAVFDADGHYVSSRATIHDIRERKKLEHEQLRYTRRLKKLSQRLIAVQEEERRRLATELHDRGSPNLAAIKITLASLEGALPPAARGVVEPHLSDAIALLDDTTTGIRAICADLRPVLLDYSGLVPALEGYAAQFTKRTAIAVRVHAPRSGKVRLGKNRESALFRIVQEALTNCAKHANASTVDIELADDEGQTTLTIKDDGAGFAATATTPANAMPGLGLITMKERTEFMGGTFVVTSHPSAGTEIKVMLENRKILAKHRKPPRAVSA